MKQALVLMLSLPIPALTQQATPPDPFQPLAFLVGQWAGVSDGRPGKGSVRRGYTRVLNDRFIHGRNGSEYPRTRQFHAEGFVNQSVDEPGSTATKVVFTSEAIENIPAGWRARETYVTHGPDDFEEIFELAAAGKPFEEYSRARLKRVSEDR
jgi:hypothetical protein